MALRRLSFLSVQFGLLLACTTVLSAQLNRGAIEGSLTDPQGAAMSGVEVTITSVATNVVTRTRTNSAGYYRAEALIPGAYRAHFAASGFTSLDITGIEVPSAQAIRVDAKLKVGSTTEKVEVKAELAMLETDASNFSSTVQTDIIQNVPLAGRDLQQLTFLLPGINNVGGPPGSNFGFDSQFGSFPDPTHLLGSAIAVNGGQSGANAWYLDGNLNISSFGENIVVNPSPDSVSEFQAITNAFSAEYSHTGGAVFSTVLKSGTNNIHGNVYEYLRNSATNATKPFSSQGGFGKNLVQFNNFGGTLGGPVAIPHVYHGKNKTFFLFSFDAQVLHQSGNNAYTVPTPLMRQGDFSEDPNVVSNLRGDTWLKDTGVPSITGSRVYRTDGALFILWDEGEDSGFPDGPIGMFVLSPFAKTNYENTIHYDHSSMLKTFQEVFGVTPLLGGRCELGHK